MKLAMHMKFLFAILLNLFIFNHSLEAGGTIEGFVTDKVTHAPIKGATIELRRCNHVIAKTTSASNGGYSFTNVKSGEYDLQASASGYQNKFCGAKVHNGCKTRVNFALQPTDGTIAGQITKITYPGPPISGATVSIIRGALIIAQTTTSGGGFYSVSRLTPGCYKVVATAPGFQSNKKGAKVHAGSTTTVNLPLQPSSGAISGTVTNTSATPIADADISLFDGPHLIAATTTNGSGFYSFPDLAPGNYTVEAIAAGYQHQIVGAFVTAGNTTTVNFILQTSPGTIAGNVRSGLSSISGAVVTVYKGGDLISFAVTDPFGNYEIPGLKPDHYEVYASADTYVTQMLGANVNAGQTAIVNFNLKPTPGSIEGTVTAFVSGLQIPGATVKIYDGDNLVATALTDDSGDYTVDGLAPGSYTIVISAPTYQTDFIEAIVESGSTTIANAALKLLPGSIGGTVTDATFTLPIPGALVEVYDDQTHIGEGTTDEMGNYLISGIPPGSYSVVASADKYRSESAGAKVAASITTTVDFALERAPGKIQGTVTDFKTGQPIGGASIEIYQGSILINSALTDGSGYYLISGIFPGQYDVVANANGYQTQTSGVTIVDSSTATVNFELLLSPGSLSGKITDSSNSHPIPNAIIELYNNGVFLGAAVTDINGNYLITNLSPQTDSCVISATNYQNKIVSTQIAPNITTLLSVTLDPFPGSVQGTVKDTGANPIPNAIVTIYSGSVAVDAVLTDASGDYLLSGLAPGSYTLIVEADGFQTASRGVQIISNTIDTEIFILEPNPGNLQGTVTDAITSDPIGGGTVSVYDGPTFITVTQTDRNGYYAIANLAPGNYTIVAQANNHQTQSVGASITSIHTTTVNFALQPNPGTLAGNVKAASSSTNLPGITIQVFQMQSLIASGLTDSFGNYSIPNLAPGSYTVVALGNQTYQSATNSATITSSNTTTLNFALQSNSGTFAGTVKDGSSNLLSGVLISVYEGDILINSTLTDSSGNYTIDGLAAGSYTITAELTGFQTRIKTGTITPGMTTNVNFTLVTSPYSVSGTVTDAVSGLPVPNATLSLFSGGSFIAYAITDTNGHYSLQGLANGTYTLQASAENYETASASITINNSNLIKNFTLTPIPVNPTNVQAKVIKDKFLTQTDRINQITWVPSSSPNITKYLVYRNGQLVQTVPANGPYVYDDHNQCKNQTVTYTIVAVNSSGESSSGASVQI